MAESDKKSVSELRVVDLKYELEKRKIDTTGNKAVLVKKLHKALTNEGLDPEKHLFDIEVDSRGSPMRKKKPLDEPDVKKEVDDSMKEDIKNEEAEAKETVNNKNKEEGKLDVNDSVNQSGESKPENNSSHENTPTEINDDKEDEKVTIKKEDEDEKNKPVDTTSKSTKSEDKDSDKEAAIKTEMIEANEENDESKTDLKSEVVEDSKNGTAALESVKDEFKKEVEPKIDLAEAARVKKEEEEEVDELEELLDDKEEDEVEENGNKDADDEDVLKLEDKSDVNGMDAEDSIHLMIGEDEEKLMAGEDDPVEKRKDVKEDRSRRGGKGQDARKNDGRSISPDNSAEEKGKKSNYRNLWVSNLASMTRAQDLKQIFSKLGKVVAAKVVTNAKTPGARCYGFVTMATADDAQACIKGLNMTELHGRLISVEAVASKPASANPGKKPEEKGKPVETTQSSDRKRRREDSEGKVNEPMGENEEKKGDTSDKASIGGDDISLKKEEEEKEEGKEGEESDKGGHSGSSPPRRSRPHVRERLGERPVATARRTNNRERIAIRTGRQDVLSFAKIKEERERQRLREKERAQREDERRRRDEMDRQRIIERRQKEELIRLEREREKVRVERLKLQKEKEEFLRLERERLAREREDLKRAQLKLEEEKRAKRAARELYEERSKRTIETSRRYDHSGPPPRKEPRRESPPSPPPTTRARYVEPRSGSRGRRIEPPPPRVKDSVRYPERSGPPSSGAAFRPSRDDRRDRERERDREDHHRKAESSRVHREERYEVPPPKGDMRYGSESWVGSSSKPYSSSGGSNSRPDNGSWMVPERKSDPHPWARNQPSQSERWAGPGGNSLPGTSSRSAMYGGIGMSIGGSLGLGNVVPNMYPPADRYDAYKTSSGSMGRKY